MTHQIIKQLPALEQPNPLRDAKILVENYADLIGKKGGNHVATVLAGQDGAVHSQLVAAWNLARVGFSQPSTPSQRRDAAAEMLTTWASTTQKGTDSTVYKRAASLMAQNI